MQFRIVSAETAQNNNQNGKRYFVLADADNQFSFDAENNELAVFFEYRELSSQEKTDLGNKQEAINEKIEAAILENIEAETLKNFLKREKTKVKKQGKIQSISMLLHHLNSYAKRNTSDYFIHKNLEGFLRRELDFYLKNEVLNLDDLAALSEGDLKRLMARSLAIKKIAIRVIEFLAQIEDFQKKLWEKKKFVVRADYCMTLDRVPEEFYDEILENEAQIEEWKKLFKLEEVERGTLNWDNEKNTVKIDMVYLKNHPYLVIDTKFFDQDFKDRLFNELAEKGVDLDKEILGLLIKSENWQALNLLQEKYMEQIKCIYIDPPYNTGSDEFIYKDNYQHSSWLTMMGNRIEKTRYFLRADGCLFCSIDDNEASNLEKLLVSIFGPMQLEACFEIKVRHERRLLRRDIPYQKVIEKLYLVSKSLEFMPSRILDKNEKDKYQEYVHEVITHGKPASVATIGGYKVEIYLSSQVTISTKPPSPKLLKRYTIRGSLITQKGSASEFYELFLRQRRTQDGYETLYKVIEMGVKGDGLGYRYIMHPEEGKGKNGIYFQGVPIAESKSVGLPHPTFFDFVKEFNICADEGGTKFSNGKKPIVFLNKVLGIVNTDSNSLIMDFFAGSGSTAHAVLNLNKKEGGNRKYILIDMGDFFDTATKPRIQKVMFASKWKDGVPQNNDGISHVFKYMYLEQYEDTLNNIEFVLPDGKTQKTLLGMDGYFLRYMLDFESRTSPCRLNVKMLDRPFDYTMRIVENSKIHDNVVVDLVETFNYLLGLHVERIKALDCDGHYYRVVYGHKDHDKVVVVWRNTEGLDLARDKEFIETTILKDVENTKLYVNGQCHVEDALSTEREFKLRMGA